MIIFTSKSFEPQKLRYWVIIGGSALEGLKIFYFFILPILLLHTCPTVHSKNSLRICWCPRPLCSRNEDCENQCLFASAFLPYISNKSLKSHSKSKLVYTKFLELSSLSFSKKKEEVAYSVLLISSQAFLNTPCLYTTSYYSTSKPFFATTSYPTSPTKTHTNSSNHTESFPVASAQNPYFNYTCAKPSPPHFNTIKPHTRTHSLPHPFSSYQ